MHHSIINWAIQVLNDKGYQIQSTDIIQDNPWAIVFRFNTDRGYVFLKQPPPALSLEAQIITILRNEFYAPVPLIIAESPDHLGFLMHDAGVQLHDYFKPHFQSDIFIQTLQDYSNLQIATINRVQQFIDLGVPDWRLEKLPSLYHDLLNHETLLIEDGLSKDDLITLKKLKSKFTSLCDDLAAYNITNTFGHADFHDKNILIDPKTKQTTLIDLGEVVITHPFFSFLNCLHRAKMNFAIEDAAFHLLLKACFTPWLAFASEEDLFNILAIMQQCWPIHSVLAEFRLLNSIPTASFNTLHREGRLANNLRRWIDQ